MYANTDLNYSFNQIVIHYIEGGRERYFTPAPTFVFTYYLLDVDVTE
jgi:hypothetical protein